MKEINLNNKKVALVDDEDFDRVNQFKWYAMKQWNTFYAVHCFRIDGKRKNTFMHRFILGLKEGEQSDHIDRNGLNNQRNNFRECTNRQNSFNQVGCNKSSQYKGVFFDKSRNKFAAQIKLNFKSTFIGRYSDEIEAAKAYDEAAKKHFGEFAYLNFK
jgi:hypothetical protein